MNVWKGVAILLAVVVVGMAVSGGADIPLDVEYTGGDGNGDSEAEPEPIQPEDPNTPTATPAPTRTAGNTATPARAEPPITPIPNPLADEYYLDRFDFEKRIHQEVNDVRERNGVEPIKFQFALVRIARYHSRDMATRGYFAHTSPDGQTRADRYDLFGYDCRVERDDGSYLTGGENIFKMYQDYTGDPAKEVVQAWMDSPGHRENLLRPAWEREGIGVWVIEEGDNVAVYVTQNFC